MRSTTILSILVGSTLMLSLAACGDDASENDHDSTRSSESGLPLGLPSKDASSTSDPAPQETSADSETKSDPIDNDTEVAAVPNKPEDISTFYPNYDPIESLEPNPSPVTTERGGLLKRFGDYAGIRNSDTGNVDIRLRILDIKPHFDCPHDQTLAPTSGEYLLVTYEVLTEESLEDADHSEFFLTSSELSIVDESGTLHENLGTDTKTCLPAVNYVNGPIYAGDHRVANLVIDTAIEHGSLIVQLPTVDGNWEWNF